MIWILVLLTLPLSTTLAQDDLFVVHFSTGPTWDTTKAPNEQVTFAEHSATSLENATAMIETDPGVRSGLFVFRIAPIRVFYPWKE